MSVQIRQALRLSLVAALRGELSRQRALIGLVMIYWVGCVAMGSVEGRPVNPFLYGPVFVLIFVLIVLFLVSRSALRLARDPARRMSIDALYTDVKAGILLEDGVRVALLLTVFSITISLFQSVKAMIPVIKPFQYDAGFAEVDRIIHGGFYPHELLQPLMGYPGVTFATLVLYNLWLPLVFVVFVMQITRADNPVLLRRYLLSFLLGWIVIGTIGAAFLSSAGPVYYARVLDLAPGAGPYGELLTYYSATRDVVPLFLTDMQEMLWGYYESGTLGPGAGISAMPSVHVALATHMYLVARHEGRWQARVFGAYALVIFLGSIHLGWHYAIDGYLGGAMMLAIWWFAGIVSGPLDQGQGSPE